MAIRASSTNLAGTLNAADGASGGGVVACASNNPGSAPRTDQLTSAGVMPLTANARATLRQPSKSVSLSRMMWCMMLLRFSSSSLRAKRSNPFLRLLRHGLLRRFAPRNDGWLEPKPQLLRFRPKPFRQSRAVKHSWRGVMIAEYDEWHRLVLRDMKSREIGEANGSEAARGDDAIDRLGAEARYPQQFFAARAVDVERKAVAVPQRPGKLRVDVERQHPGAAIDDLCRLEAVEAHQPVGLVKPVLAQQRRSGERQAAA